MWTAIAGIEITEAVFQDCFEKMNVSDWNGVQLLPYSTLASRRRSPLLISSRKSPAIALYDKVSPRTSKVRHRQWTEHYEAVLSFHIKEGPVRASVTPAPAYPTNDLSFSVQIPRNCVPIVNIIHKHTRISRNVNSILCQCHDYCMRNFFVMT